MRCWTLLFAAAAAQAAMTRPTTLASIKTLPIKMTASEPVAAPMYNVYLLNDSFNMREYVQRVLMMVAYITEGEANRIMMEANWAWGAQVGTWEKPLAEHIHAGMTKAGLEAVIRPVKEDTESGSLTDRYDGDDLIPN